jgi:hypothetical protein
MNQPRLSLLLLLFCCCCAFLGQSQTTNKPPSVVRTGLYLNNLYDLNMNAHSFYADFYIWFKWKGDFDPTNVEFVNAIEKWSVTNNSFDGDSTTVHLKDGSNYRIFRIEGRFFHSFSLNRFPLDEHELDIQIENPDADKDSIIYLPDTSTIAASVRPTLNLVGWDQRGCHLLEKTHDYGSNFGNPEENAHQYSNLTYTLTLGRPLSFFFLKMLLPLMIVMFMSLGALTLHPDHIDTRSSLPIGGLLTAVFLQQSYSDALPDSGYMVLMDKIYLLVYILTALVMLHVIIGGNIVSKSGDKNRIARLDKRETWLAVVYFVVFWLGVGWLSVV